MGAEKRSAGLMMFRRAGEGIEVFLIHPGGPFFDKKDEGAWSIPKGESGPGEKNCADADGAARSTASNAAMNAAIPRARVISRSSGSRRGR